MSSSAPSISYVRFAASMPTTLSVKCERLFRLELKETRDKPHTQGRRGRNSSTYGFLPVCLVKAFMRLLLPLLLFLLLLLLLLFSALFLLSQRVILRLDCPPDHVLIAVPVAEPGGSACCYWNVYGRSVTTRRKDSPAGVRSAVGPKILAEFLGFVLPVLGPGSLDQLSQPLVFLRGPMLAGDAAFGGNRLWPG